MRRWTKRRRTTGAISVRWSRRRRCPRASALATFVDAPAALGRRLALTGVVSVEEGKRSQKDLLPGQRLVSQRGDLWRWDGYSASADAPSQAAARLEQRNRLEALEAQLDLREARARSGAGRFTRQRRPNTAAASEAVRAASRELREREEALLAAQGDSALAARAVAERTQRFAAHRSRAQEPGTGGAKTRGAPFRPRPRRSNALPDANALSEKLEQARAAAAEARSQYGRSARPRSMRCAAKCRCATSG